MIRTVLFVAVLALCGCSERELDDLFSDDELTLVDLSHALSAEMPFWPGPETNPFVHDTIRAHEDGAPSMAAYRTPEHHGTHIDAPVHFAQGQASVDEIPVEDFFAPLVVINVTAQAATNPDYGVTMEDLLEWERVHGEIAEGAVVVMQSGWADHWEDPARYFGRDENGTMHFPGFSEDAARWLALERRVAGIGVDTPSIDPGNAAGFPAHGAGNGNGIYHLENLAQVDQLPASGGWVVVAPVKIQGGSGGQVRVFGIVPS